MLFLNGNEVAVAYCHHIYLETINDYLEEDLLEQEQTRFEPGTAGMEIVCFALPRIYFSKFKML